MILDPGLLHTHEMVIYPLVKCLPEESTMKTSISHEGLHMSLGVPGNSPTRKCVPPVTRKQQTDLSDTLISDWLITTARLDYYGLLYD